MNRDVVIVDGESITRMNLRRVLEANNYNVVGEASDGFGAVEVCKKYKPTLVIMDIDIPLLDGIRTGKILIKEQLVGGVILSTELEDKLHIEMAKSIGAYGYLVKPINEKYFIPTIEMCISKVEEFNNLKKDLNNISNKLNERKNIERAKGILEKVHSISENEAYNRIRKLSMDRRMSISEIANIIIIGYEA